MNGFTLIGAVILLPLFYFFQYVLKQPKPWLAVGGLFCLTVGMMLDHLAWLYVTSTFLAFLFALYGAVQEPP